MREEYFLISGYVNSVIFQINYLIIGYAFLQLGLFLKFKRSK